MTNFIDNIWFQLFAYLVGFTGTVLSILSFKKKKIKPVYIKRTTHLVQQKLSDVEGLSLQYDNQDIKNLTITNIAIWNAGKKTLKHSDISTNDKLRIETRKGVTVLRHSILKVSNQANGITTNINDDNSSINVNFDYLDYNEGIAYQFIHNGESSNDILIKGSIIGFGKIKSNDGEFKSKLRIVLEEPLGKVTPGKDDKSSMFRIVIIVSFILIGSTLIRSSVVMSVILILHGLIYLSFAFIFRAITKTPKEFEFIEE